MANSARNQPGVERSTVSRGQEDPNPLDTVQVFYEKNKKVLSTVTTVVLGVILVFFAYTKLYKGPAEEKAATALAMPQLYFQADSLNMALNGDGKNLGFTKIAKKYEGTAAGNLALYYEGVCFLKMGDPKSAIKSLEAFNGKGTMLAYQAWGLIGDAYMENGNTAKAIENFKKAVGDKDDVLTTPMYLYHLGLAYEAGNQANDAKAAFMRIRDEYPRSLQARDMDKELAKLGELN